MLLGHLFCDPRRSDDETPTASLNACITDELELLSLINTFCDSDGLLSELVRGPRRHVSRVCRVTSLSACFLASFIILPSSPVIARACAVTCGSGGTLDGPLLAPRWSCLLLSCPSGRALEDGKCRFKAIEQLRHIGMDERKGSKQGGGFILNYYE